MRVNFFLLSAPDIRTQQPLFSKVAKIDKLKTHCFKDRNHNFEVASSDEKQ